MAAPDEPVRQTASQLNADIVDSPTTGVNDADYKTPFPLTAKLNKLTIKLDRPQLSPQDIKKLEAAERNNRLSE